MTFLFVIIFGGFGILLIVNGWNGIRQGRASLQWPQVPGTIVESHIEEKVNTRGSIYTARIAYAYMVGGRSCRGTAIAAGAVFKGPLPLAEELVQRYPVGQQVRVAHDPQEPETALLEPGVSMKMLLPSFAGLVMLVVAIVIASAA